MNPSVPQSEIDDATERDPASAAAEFGGEFRSDIEAYVTRETIDACTIPGRLRLPPTSGTRYVAAVDLSGGSSDSMTLAIAHNDKGATVLDTVREVRPPFSPEAVVATFVETLKAYRCHRVVGDRYAGEFAREPFRKLGLTYDLSERPASDIYRDALPLLTSGKAELLDVPRLAMQLHSLERRVGRSGKDLISHPVGGHDDVANVAMAAMLLCSTGKAVLRFSPEFIARIEANPVPYSAGWWARQL